MKYRKKPVVIEAIEFTVSNFEQIRKFTNNQAHSFIDDTCIIPTLEGQHIASLGDFIIRGVQGEYYPCKPHIFLETYEREE